MDLCAQVMLVLKALQALAFLKLLLVIPVLLIKFLVLGQDGLLLTLLYVGLEAFLLDLLFKVAHQSLRRLCFSNLPS